MALSDLSSAVDHALGERVAEPADIEAGAVVAVGFSSAVVDRVPEGEGQGENDDLALRGHVLLLDLDDVRYDRALDDLTSRDGVGVLLESSPGSWHVWGLAVRSLEEQALESLLTHCEPLHSKQSYRRRRAILRRSGKYRVDADGHALECYRAAPQVERVVVNVDEETPPLSRGHLELLRVMVDEQDAEATVPSDKELEAQGADLVGDTLIRSDYLTFDDATKRDRAGGADGAE